MTHAPDKVMAMSTTTLNLVTVETDQAKYIKARATLEDERLTIQDRRNHVLEVVTATREDIDSRHWRYGSATVEVASGCACGGTRTIRKA